MKSPKKYRFHLALPFILMLLVFVIVSLINKPKHRKGVNEAKSSISTFKQERENPCVEQADCQLPY
jgi:hypothetical protein